MKFLYLTKWKMDETSGVYKKIIAQQKSLDRLGHDCDVLFVDESCQGILLLSSGGKISIDLNKKTCLSLAKKYDANYVRFELFRHKFYKLVFMCMLKAQRPIILEIPTYPPHEESAARVREKLNQHHYLSAFKTYCGIIVVKHDLKKQINCSSLVCNNGDSTVFKGVPTIRIENGIDFGNNPFVKRIKHRDFINIIGVSNFSIWNGYDLAIVGLKKYTEKTGNRNIRITFVGDKNKACDLISLTNKLGLSDLICFTDLLGGKDLDDAYSKADAALGGLGDHRRKAFSNSSLKAKEYAARGLVMLLSESEGIEDYIKSRSFIVPKQELPVDFEAFTTWYSQKDIETFSSEIHSFALENYSWDKQMLLIVNKLNELLVHYGKNNK